MTEPGAFIYRLIVCAVTLLCVAARSTAQMPPPIDWNGKMVTSVQVTTPERNAVEDNPRGIPLQAGQPYQAGAIRESIRALYRSGKYAEIEALAYAEPGGVRVEFRVRENYYVNVVRITGLRSPQGEALALAALKLRVGEPYHEIELQESLARLRETLNSMGFFRAEVKTETVPNPTTRQMDFFVHVEPGPRVRIGALEVSAADDHAVPDALRWSKLKTGMEIKTNTLDRAGERVRKKLVKKGHLGARAVARRGDYDSRSNTLPVTLEVYTGPILAVQVEGAKISERKLKRLIPVYQEGAVDEDLLQEGRRNLRDYLESEGYFDSQVNYSQQEDAKTHRQIVVYHVERGPQRRLVGVAFEGNKFFSRDLLESRLREQKATTSSRGRFGGKLLADDTESIKDLYEANGFLQAEVTSEIQSDYQGKEGDLFVTFHIHEGSQTLVSELKLEGNTLIPSDVLLANIGSTPGQPFSEFNVQGDRDNVLAIYFNEGFSDARFDYQKEDAAQANRVRLTYKIAEGPQARIKGILYSGMEHTRLRTIERQMKLSAGEPLRQGDLIESQRNLYNLGIFTRVQIAPQNPEGEETDKTLIVNVDEARRYTIAYGGGFELQRGGGSTSDPTGTSFRASPRGVFEISKANVGGLAHTLAFRARASTFQYRFSASYLAPNFLSIRTLRLELGGFAEKESDVRTFTDRKYEGSVQLVHQLTPFTTLGYRYAFRRVLVDPESLRVPPQQIPLLSQPTKISSFGVAMIRDHRDNPAEATKGNFNSVDTSAAAKVIGATGNFVRIFAQNSTFHPLGPIIFARSTRFGVLQRYAGSHVTDIPLPERIYAGGGNSIRGFGYNQAGPRTTTGYPFGGEAMLIFNQEVRFPVRVPFMKQPLGGGVFYDAGNVFSGTDRITFRFQPRAIPLGLGDYFSHTVGLSLRYSTPIGPVRLDLGYLLNNVRFNFQDVTTNVVHGTRLPRFQFFFNIGSMF